MSWSLLLRGLWQSKANYSTVHHRITLSNLLVLEALKPLRKHTPGIIAKAFSSHAFREIVIKFRFGFGNPDFQPCPNPDQIRSLF